MSSDRHRKGVRKSMNDLVHIGNTDILVKEYRGQRVAIFRNIDTVYMIDQKEHQEEVCLFWSRISSNRR